MPNDPKLIGVITASFEGFAEALKSVGVAASQFGASMNQLNAAFGISAEEAQARADYELLVANGVDPAHAAEAVMKVGPIFAHDGAGHYTHIGVERISDLEFCRAGAFQNDVVQPSTRYVEVPE